VARSCAKHREARNARTRIWQAKFPEKVKEACRNWRIANPEKARLSCQKWKLKNSEKVKEFYRRNSAKRRAFKRNALISDLDSIRRIYERCRELRQWFNVVVDHIIPLARGGTHCPCNLQIIYQSENEKKHAKLSYKPTVIFT
jgi:5-methylcytosine-specific restriction endonuclease McrA